MTWLDAARFDLADIARYGWHSPWVFALLVLLPLLEMARANLRRRRTAVLPSLGIAGDLPTTWRTRTLFLPGVLRAVGLVLMVAALARPQLGIGRVETSTDAVAIQLVIDRSGSMEQEMELGGAMLTRIDVVKQVVGDFLIGNQRDLQGRTDDLIGLVSFARFAETACPLIRDPHALARLVSTIQLAKQQYEDGTAIGDGLALAAARLRRTEEDLRSRAGTGGAIEGAPDLTIKSKLVILLTDGDDNASTRPPLESAALAAEWGIKVYTIGIGAGVASYQTIRHPVFGERRVRSQSNVDEALLKQIADSTGGRYFRAQDGEALRAVYTEIDRMEKSSVQTVQYTDLYERFTPFAASALLCIGASTLLGSTILRRNA